jgi:hypothetical protein
VVSGTPGVSRDRLLQQAERSWLPAALLLGVLDAMLQVSSFLLCLCFISSFGKLIWKWEIGHGGHGGPGRLHPMAPGTF